MSRRSVHVERLELRVRGVAPHAAREAAQGLARELLEELARGGGAEGARAGGVSVERVEARVPSSEGLMRGEGGQRAVARRVAGAVRARIR
ncbi:MAG TPA: hypothetical protein VFX96_09615 [Pyrinomonadaceae bacterium]|nr:hypothetical protein [Pyrinomonadaceae bacterium]